MKEKLISQIKLFSQDEWNTFIRKLSFGYETIPSLDFVEGKFASKLIALYLIVNELDKKMLEFFFNSCIYNLRIIDKKQANISIIYTYIHLISESKPVEYKQDVVKIYEDKELSGLKKDIFYLEDLLLMSLINLEDIKNPILEEKIYFLENKDYKAYLKIYYYAYMGKNQNCLSLISKKITSSEETEETYFNLYNSIIDVVPKYINFSNFLNYFLQNNIKIAENEILKNSMGMVINHFKEILEEKFHPIIFILEDCFNQNFNNAISYPQIIQSIEDIIPKELRFLITKYYDDLLDFNDYEVTNDDELIKACEKRVRVSNLQE